MQIKNLLLSGLLAIGVLSLSACGFGLRGISDNSIQLAPAYSQVNLITDNNAVAYAFKPRLSTQLAQIGVATAADAPNQIRVNNLRYREYRLLGVLTEIRLVLTADVGYQINGQTIVRTVQTERSYQHNEASVTTSDQQGEQAKIWLQDSLAHRIAEQYYALGSQSASQ
ncbi:hypothetical protein [Moraxella marmotae]|uniref:hypothetical protein n=1 Tax=Moraxella marmotae TaxID=3344520 RepID=UPI0035D43991